VETWKVFAFLCWLARDYQALGLPDRPETFPKQAAIAPDHFGNWLRLFGHHHKYDHWSQVWDGAAWLRGAEAVAYILSLKGDDPGLIPAEALAAGPPWSAPTAPACLSCFRPTGGQLGAIIIAYINKLPAGLGEGQHRDDYGFNLACFLVRDLALSDAEAMPWMEVWDGRNAVPKGAERLRRLLAHARKYGRRPYGCGLTRAARPRLRGKGTHRVRTICRQAEVG
jgi:hypothetical protein